MTMTESHYAATGLDLHEAFHYVQPSDPGAIGAGLYWLNTSTSPLSLFRRSAANDAWIAVGQGYSVRTLTSSAAINVSDDFIRLNAATSAFTATLPMASSVPAGKRLHFVKVDTSIHLATVAAGGSDTIGQVASIDLSLQDPTLELVSDSVSQWMIAPDTNIKVSKLGDTMTGDLLLTNNLLAAQRIEASGTLANTGDVVRLSGGVASVAPTAGTWSSGDFVLDLTRGLFWVCLVAGTPGAWYASGDVNPQKILTAAYTVTSVDSTLLCDATSASFAVTLPLASSLPSGKKFRFMKIDSSVNAVTIAVSGSDHINGSTTRVLSTQYQYAHVESNGSATYWVFG